MADNTILVVEDEAAIRDMIGMQVESVDVYIEDVALASEEE